MTSFANAPGTAAGELRTDQGIRVHAEEDFEAMRRAGRLAAETLDFIIPHVKPGVSTGEPSSSSMLCLMFSRALMTRRNAATATIWVELRLMALPVAPARSG